MSFNVKLGDYVRKGDFIGLADNTGFSSGDHVHFELKPVSFTTPVNKTKDSDLTNTLQTNGYYGAVDPYPYLEKPPLPKVPMYLGERGDNVKNLQFILKYLGHFPKEQEVTGYYGNITRQAVFSFQQFVSLSWYEKAILKGSRVGPKTLAFFNQILG
jgi:hypothetical protein